MLALLFLIMSTVPAEKLAITSQPSHTGAVREKVKNEIIDSDRKIHRSLSDDLSNETQRRPRGNSFLHPVIVAEDMAISQQRLGCRAPASFGKAPMCGWNWGILRLEQLFQNKLYCRAALAFATAMLGVHVTQAEGRMLHAPK